MGTITAQGIADRAWPTLQDTVGTVGTRWPEAEILGYINDGQREVCVYAPRACTKTARPLAEPGTRQTAQGLGLADLVRVVNVPRNFNAAGNAPGRAITVQNISWINEHRPNWHADSAADAVNFFFDPDDPKGFYVWPPANGSTRLEVIYHATPQDLGSMGTPIVLDDIYANALTHYVLFRAFSKNAAFVKNPALSAQQYQMFLQSLGVQDANAKKFDPTLRLAGNGSGVASAAQEG